MQFDSWSALVDMGGHGPFVWSSYALFVLVFALLLGASWQRHRRWLTAQQRAYRRHLARTAASTVSSPSEESCTRNVAND